MSRNAKTRFVIICVTLLGVFAETAIKAFSTPWVWNFDQFALVIFGGCLVLGLAAWGFRWMKFGTQGVQEQWTSLWERVDALLTDKQVRVRNYAIWIIVALALFLYFNWKQSY